jgi:hypothetical protein
MVAGFSGFESGRKRVDRPEGESAARLGKSHPAFTPFVGLRFAWNHGGEAACYD